MPGGTLFTVDVGNPLHAEHFDPVTAQWYSDGSTPVDLTSPSSAPGGWTYGPAPIEVVGGITYGPGPAGTYFPPGEVGPALLLPDGRVFATGAAPGGDDRTYRHLHPGSQPAGPRHVHRGARFRRRATTRTTPAPRCCPQVTY